MLPLVPGIIAEEMEQGNLQGNLQAASLFLDISGFTYLTEQLLLYGSEGAETLAELLETLFTPLVAQVEQYGGFVSCFAGDALWALFPGEALDASTRALYAAQAMQTHLSEHPTQTHALGSFMFSLKIGVGFGDVDWGIFVPNAPQVELGLSAVYYFRGAAVDACGAAESHANPAEIVLDASVPTVLTDAETLSDRFRRLKKIIAPPPMVTLPAKPTVSAATLERLLNPMVRALATRTNFYGEFRQVVSLMVNLQEEGFPNALQKFVEFSFSLQETYGGFLNQITYGDKGCSLLFFWGMPLSLEDDLTRAIDFAESLVTGAPVPCRAGLTFQLTYAGFTGSIQRRQYSGLGRGINLAARLMTAAEWGEILIPRSVAQRIQNRFKVAERGVKTLKGFEQPIETYCLEERLTTRQTEEFFEGDMIGRTAEKAQLHSLLAPIFRGEFAGLIAMIGEPGIGKSRMAYQLQSELTDCQFLLCQTDQIQLRPLETFRFLLRNYFEQIAEPAADSAGFAIAIQRANRKRFEARLNALLQSTPADDLRAEIERTAPFLGALLGLSWKDSLYEQVEPEWRFQNTISAIKALLQAESLRQPLVLHIEDAHWLDADSVAVLQNLSRNMHNYPIAILFTARPEPGGVTQLVRNSVPPGIPYNEVNLNAFSKAELAAFATVRLGYTPPPDLLDLLFVRSEGNPFFAEQILLFLKEHDVQSEHAENILPADVQAVLIARLDRLSQDVREVVQTASVLGREFEINLLTAMLRNDGRVLEKIAEAEKATVWVALSQIHYIFKHALLRDTAYTMQLITRRRALHALAADALESLYAAELYKVYGALAYHTEQAGQEARAQYYLQLAGNVAAESFQNGQALDYYQRARRIIANTATPAELLSLDMKIERLYNHLGNRQLQFELLAQMEQAAAQQQDKASLVEIYARWGQAAQMTGQYALALEKYQQALPLADALQNQALQAQIYNHWATMYWLQGQYPNALEKAQISLELARAANDRHKTANALRNLGVVYWFLHQLEAAEQAYLEALELYRAENALLGQAATLNNLAMLAGERGEYEENQRLYQDSIALYRKIGNRQGECNATINLNTTYQVRAQYEQALVCLQRARYLAQEVNDRRSLGNVYNHFGLVNAQLGEYATALQHLETAINILQTTGDPRGEGLCHTNLGYVLRQLGNYTAARQHVDESLRLAAQLGEPHVREQSLTVLAGILTEQSLAGENIPELETTLHDALTLAREMQRESAVWELLAMQIELLLKAQRAPETLPLAEEILTDLAPVLESAPDAPPGFGVGGAREPARIYWAAAQALKANHQPQRAEIVLQVIRQKLQTAAQHIQDPTTRQRFLTAPPYNRRVMA
ncbi:MAG: adenylate/guanylate cyclase domain-containing protein [Anaerolineales bacterium]